VNANCALHLWHHTRKGNGGEISVEAARGAQAFIDACRSVRILETMTKKERNDLLPIVPNIGDERWYFREFNGKRNFAPPTSESLWYRYVSIELDNAPAEGFASGDEIGVATRWNYPQLDLTHAKSVPGRDGRQGRGVQPTRLGEALAAMVESGPMPSIHGVLRWRLKDLAMWVWEEFRVSVSETTLSRILRALGCRKLSARPRHHAHAAGAGRSSLTSSE